MVERVDIVNSEHLAYWDLTEVGNLGGNGGGKGSGATACDLRNVC